MVSIASSRRGGPSAAARAIRPPPTASSHGNATATPAPRRNDRRDGVAAEHGRCMSLLTEQATLDDFMDERTDAVVARGGPLDERVEFGVVGRADR